jgi:hypothetical protein
MYNKTSAQEKAASHVKSNGFFSLIGIILFFSGWIYRWAYFSFFGLDINLQSFLSQSFFIVPIQIFFGSVYNILRTAILILSLPLLSSMTVIYVNRLRLLAAILIARILIIPVRHKCLCLAKDRSGRRQPFFPLMLNETVVAAWALILTFWLSHQQAQSDARRDAVDSTSTLPVVSLLVPTTGFVLGQDLRHLDDNNQLITDPELKNYSLIGDHNLARDLRSTSLSSPEKKQVWRLLAQETGGWLYLVRTMPPSANKDDRPMVLAIPNASQGQALILGPEIPKKRSF